MVPQKIGKKTEGIGNQRKNQDHTEHSIVKIGKTTQKTPGDPRICADTQTSPVKTGVKNSHRGKIIQMGKKDSLLKLSNNMIDWVGFYGI